MRNLPVAALFALTTVLLPMRAGAAVDLAGTVVGLDSLPRSGVVVALSGTTLQDTTNADGSWLLATPATSLGERKSVSFPLSSHIYTRDGHLGISLSGRDILGRGVALAAARAEGAVWLPRQASGTGPDTLTYSWQGKVFLKDTISRDSLAQKGILRRFDTTVNPSIIHGYVKDSQGHIYRTRAIGKTVWMAENLNFKVDNSWCYQDSAVYCGSHGRLYPWAAAMGVDPSYNATPWATAEAAQRGICPQGWRLPLDSEWTGLLRSIDSARSGLLLRSRGDWYAVGGSAGVEGTTIDSLGFKAMAGGYRHSNGTFHNLHTHAAFWLSRESDKVSEYTGRVGSFVWTAHFYVGDAGATHIENYKDLGFSLRCVQGEGSGK